MSLVPEDPYVEKLTRKFYTSTDVTKHFRRRHLSKLPDDNRIECQVCCVTLDHKQHLRNHALLVHGTVS